MMIYRILNSFRAKELTNTKSIDSDCNCEHLLYDYILWNNTYQNTWYAIKRENITAFFAGGEYRQSIPEGGYRNHESLSDLIKLIIDDQK